MAVAMRVVDLSFPIRPHFRWTGALFQSTVVALGCHAFTHVDAPVHFLPGDRDIVAMPMDQWMGPAAVVDLTHLGDNGVVTAADLERRAAHVERGVPDQPRSNPRGPLPVHRAPAPSRGRRWLTRSGHRSRGVTSCPGVTT